MPSKCNKWEDWFFIFYSTSNSLANYINAKKDPSIFLSFSKRQMNDPIQVCNDSLVDRNSY